MSRKKADKKVKQIISYTKNKLTTINIKGYLKKVTSLLLSVKSSLLNKSILSKIKDRLSCRIKKAVNGISEAYKTIEYMAVNKDFSKLKEKILAKKVAIKYSLIVLLTVLITFVIIQFDFRPVVVVSVDNKPIAVVANKKSFDDIFNKLQATWKSTYNQQIKLNNMPTFRVQILPKRLISSYAQVANAIESNTNLLVPVYAIQVEGEVRAVLKNQNEAISVLDLIKNRYASSNSETLGFFEKVDVVLAYAMPNVILSKDECIDLLTKSVDQSKEYKVRKGDTLWDIASANNISIDKLYALNPELTEDIKFGQIIKLSAPKSIINVKITECVAMQEDTPFETKFQSDPNKYRGERKTVSKGQTGKKDLKVEIVKQNGVEIGKVVLEENVITEPKPEIIAVGAKVREDKSGMFRVPAFGSVTSRFGYRWGRFHEGIDIGGDVGDPVYAADGGTVIFSGAESGYGNLVKISHGNGYVTYYGHNSKNLVKVGQKVAKGALIAKLGNTGNSTGPHVHFQVEKNGTPVDPLKFLK